jgi:hypothetical protein
MPGEPMKCPTKVCAGRSNRASAAAGLHRAPRVITTHLVGEGQRLDLVVGDVDQGQLEFVVDLLELAPQLPLAACGSITVSGSSNSTADTSLRTRPRPSEIFCLASAVRPAARLLQLAAQFQHLGDAGPRASRMSDSPSPRLRKGNARFSATVMVS